MAEKAKIQFYPLDLTYRIVDNRPLLLIFGRDTEGKQICIVDDSFEPYFYVVLKEKKDVEEFIESINGFTKKEDELICSIKRTEIENKNYLGKEVKAIKIIVNHPKAVPVIREAMEERKEVELSLEANILYTRRYLIDKGITPLTLCEAEVEPIELRVRTRNNFRALKIHQVSEDPIPEPKILSIDIETYNPQGKNIVPEKYPIIMLAVYGKNFHKVITWKPFHTKKEFIEFVKSEADLILRFKEIVETYKPDIITGYYSDGFDFPYIKTRASKYKIEMDIALDYSGITLSRGKSESVSITGIPHLDVLKFVRGAMSTSLSTDYYDLDSVAFELIGKRKEDVDLENLHKVWDNKPEELEKYCNYNLNDAKITHMLAERILPNIIELVKVVGIPLDDVSRNGFSQLVEWYLIKQAKQFNELAPNKPTHDEIKERITKSYKGAFVFEPKPGLYKEVAVFDFRSLYPTIIASHNISPSTLKCGCCEETGEHAPADGKEYWFCKKKKGFIPQVIEDLIMRRMRIKELMKKKEDKMLDAREQSLKIMANSFYGYLGFYGARWYSIECARSVTAWGRYYIHKVIDDAKANKFEVLYSDTDSIFLNLEGKKREDAEKLIEKINLELPELMELELEGFYKSCIFVSAKAGDLGAKKKYALLAEDDSIIIKGFETVRRNWSLIAKEVQEKVLGIVLREGNVEKAMKYVREVIDDLKNKRIPLEKVTIHTQLQKEILEYESKGPHVAAAQRMKNLGIDVGPGSMISFVVVQGNEKIRDRVKLPEEIEKKDYDADYYINNQIVPSVERIFEVLGHKKEDLIESKEQSKLHKFF